MPSLEREANRLRSLVDDADAIIVGIGSGMSSAAGFNHYNRAGMARFEVRGEDVPRCPHCGWQLVPWVRDDTFLQGAAWREGLGRYERFVRERGDSRVLLLELGVGEMTPGIITFPFWSMAAKLPDAHLLSVNISSGSAPLQLGSKAEAIQADLGALLSAARAGGEQRAIRPWRAFPSGWGAATSLHHPRDAINSSPIPLPYCIHCQRML